MEDREMFGPVAGGHYTPAALRRRIRLRWLLVSEHTIACNRWSPLQPTASGRRWSGSMKWQMECLLVESCSVCSSCWDSFCLVSLFISWIKRRVIVQHVWNGAKRVRDLKASQCPFGLGLLLKLMTAVWKAQMSSSFEWMWYITSYSDLNDLL